MREAEVTRARRAGPAGCWGGARTRWLAPQVGEGSGARRGPGGLTGTGGAPLPGGEGGRRGEMAAVGLLTGERGSCGSAWPGCASPLTRCRRERPARRRGLPGAAVGCVGEEGWRQPAENTGRGRFVAGVWCWVAVWSCPGGKAARFGGGCGVVGVRSEGSVLFSFSGSAVWGNGRAKSCRS